MIDRETIRAWAEPPPGADRYLRPFVARGPLQRRGAAVIGLNPATEIRPADVPMDKYLDLLLDIDAFTMFYQDLRVRRGKSKTSPTRIGLNGMAKWLVQHGWRSVVETNISPYPTAKAEELDRVPAQLQSRHIFLQLIHALAPSVVILHGEDALSEFTSKIAPALVRSSVGFSDLVDKHPQLGRYAWEGTENCDVFVCRHLRFFGHNGGRRFAALERALATLPDAQHAVPAERQQPPSASVAAR